MGMAKKELEAPGTGQHQCAGARAEGHVTSWLAVGAL